MVSHRIFLSQESGGGEAFSHRKDLDQTTRQDPKARFEWLVRQNILHRSDFDEAVRQAGVSGRRPEVVIMTDYRVKKADLGQALSSYYGVPFVAYSEGLRFPWEHLTGVKRSFLKRNAFVPFMPETGEDGVWVAFREPDDDQARDAARRVFPRERIRCAVALEEDILAMIDLLGRRRRENARGLSPGIDKLLVRLDAGGDQMEEEAESPTEQDSIIVQLVNQMILDAHRLKASDIHIEPRPGRGATLIRFRIDGVCRVYRSIPANYQRAVVSRLKIMSDLDISERRLPQDGKIMFRSFAPLDLELRVATVPLGGLTEDVVLRILPGHVTMGMEGIGMNTRDESLFREMIEKPYGLILVVGPTGSGKTTTLHAALARINRAERKIWTAEDPVEITQDGLRQVQVNRKIGLTFAAALRSFLRADPDVIMVGEMRDRETAAIGIEASLTGHLVLSTLHTNSAAETIVRLLNMGLDPYNFGDAILGILAQRLVRTLCVDCKEPYQPASEEYDALRALYGSEFDAQGLSDNRRSAFFRPKGCPKCNRCGYSGRTALHELLWGGEAMKRLVRRRAPAEELRAQAMADGMTTLLQNGIRKVCLGLTDLAEVRRVCQQ